METHPESLLHEIAAESGVEGRTAFQAAEAGDETALEVCRNYVNYLAGGLTSLINILRPEAVAKESFSRHGGRITKVLRAERGNDAGIIGAAMLGRVM